ncbi:hypothetical protein XA68_14563 [Ophiocordyceps unilateralis]|uniref:Uncharacterized protein n=1 Tax=Ophiocordyceps unilateralis TaxID=268505 RepID=A0A2A9P8Q4_OPHUN|nr:hypothetical protein XA68_14563 [Ophiocordyceps unilateralis]
MDGVWSRVTDENLDNHVRNTRRSLLSALQRSQSPCSLMHGADSKHTSPHDMAPGRADADERTDENAAEGSATV